MTDSASTPEPTDGQTPPPVEPPPPSSAEPAYGGPPPVSAPAGPAYDAPPPVAAPAAPAPLDDASRQSLLAQAVARSVAGGARVESSAPYQAIMVTGNKVNHTLHLILTLATCSLWGWVWLVLALVVKEKRTVLTVDAYGNILSQ